MVVRDLIKWTILAAAIMCSGPSAFAAEPAKDVAAIRELMRGTFDKPESPLVVEPLVVKGDHAVAGWEQSGNGGRALLRRVDGKWLIWLCSGDALKNPQALAEMGVPKGDAAALAASVVAEEEKLPAAKRQLFSKFDGIVMVQGSADRDHGREAAAPPHGHPPSH